MKFGGMHRKKVKNTFTFLIDIFQYIFGKINTITITPMLALSQPHLCSDYCFQALAITNHPFSEDFQAHLVPHNFDKIVFLDYAEDFAKKLQQNLKISIQIRDLMSHGLVVFLSCCYSSEREQNISFSPNSASILISSVTYSLSSHAKSLQKQTDRI